MNDETKKGKAAGGFARAEKLEPERRKAIAKKAAIARWGEKPLVAIRRGNFNEEFGFDADCYVLDDERNTAVLSQRGMAAALGFTGKGGNNLIRFITGKGISPYIGSELREKIDHPIVFKREKGGSDGSVAPFSKGYDVTVLIDLCNAVVNADNNGAVIKSQEQIAKQVRVIISSSAKSGIQELVYKLAGFDSTKEQFVQAFKRFISEEAKKYEKEFPPELYAEWARLYDLKIPDRGWPWEFKHLTVKHVYTPLAKSNGRLLSLLRETKDKSGEGRAKLFQFLNEIGTRALRMQLGRVLGIAETSINRTAYENKMVELFGGQSGFNFDPPSAS